ncbi:aminotransferase class I/II-fold pyridoxal phosphate-dependent enzyme [Chryseobacterium sp. BIGb0232]|uniref:aminotransferase class I/II-fold pyridoxal phosphate-dependent enzyme n=1 Tax=Chryseobacterium sp. BIGb0232 TaxID=2940598 RepID=UPI000F494F80|nr:aminotransferase class I/II-fold pyridoxal phosphate-dependent enzyme [Chryseobacterium sp. BIGb0232]MCS4302827.1 methionine aminotransferase [Chryseobacterium sp. BIGb0232]ROS17479.1 succinyldiaminopimelate aminotransferase [Chryseobacterium nakagawai]
MKEIFGFTHYSFFTEMSELALQHKSFDLSLGLPDFDIDERLKSFLKESADLDTHNYEPLAGNPLLITNIIGFNTKRKNSISLQSNEITIVPCATFALYTALKSILNQHDEVIIIQPSYYTYAPAVVMNGGIPVYYDLEPDFTINWDLLKTCISEKTKAIIVNSPQNPTGKIWKQEDWNRLYELIKDRDAYLISEEIYDTYCYDDAEHYSSFIHPELKERTFCIFSFGKMFHTSGWKVSYMLASEKLTALFRIHQQYISYSANAPAQYALAKYLEVFDPSENKAMMQKKRDIFDEMLKETPLQIEKQAEGSVFQVVNFRNVSKTMTDVEFSKWLTIDKKVACLPLSAFYNSRQNSDYIRFSFAKKDEVIIQALEHLKKNL